jgi:hypothetical protein
MKEGDMSKRFALIIVLIGVMAVLEITATGYASQVTMTSATEVEKASSKGTVMLALSDEQVKVCEEERKRLIQQLNECGSDEQCQRRVQANIDAHNIRCSR